MSPRTSSVRAAAGALLLATAMPALAATAPRWTDTPLARAQALALLQTFNAELLSHPSATRVLERWCRTYRMATPARIVAVHSGAADKPLPPDMRAVLGIGPKEPVNYRHVALTCGTHVLSEADNWYVPARLTAAMNRTLERTEAPFGKVVAPLRFRRHRLSSQLLWSPLPADWALAPPPAAHPGDALSMPHDLLRHRAVLVDGHGRPFSLVVETYTRAVLDVPAPESDSHR